MPNEVSEREALNPAINSVLHCKTADKPQQNVNGWCNIIKI